MPVPAWTSRWESSSIASATASAMVDLAGALRTADGGDGGVQELGEGGLRHSATTLRGATDSRAIKAEGRGRIKTGGFGMAVDFVRVGIGSVRVEIALVRMGVGSLRGG